jgi:hypothetical protein
MLTSGAALRISFTLYTCPFTYSLISTVIGLYKIVFRRWLTDLAGLQAILFNVAQAYEFARHVFDHAARTEMIFFTAWCLVNILGSTYIVKQEHKCHE